MKKRFVLMAMAGVALAGCVSDEVADVVQQEQKRKITFESPLAYDNSSRAKVFGEIENPYPQDETFVIYATQYEAGNYNGWEAFSEDKGGFDSKVISFDTSVDGWAPKTNEQGYYYWTDGMQYAFAASSPGDIGTTATRTYSAAGLTINNFEIPADPAEQYDLLFSKRIYDQDASDLVKIEGQYSGIQLTFQHALSSIHFSLENQTLLNEDVDQRETVVLKKISIVGVYDTGNFAENINEGTTGNYNLSYSREDDGNVSPEWESTGNVTTESEPYIAYSCLADGENGVDLEFPSTPQYVSKYIEKLEKDNSDNKGKYGKALPLLLLPQELPDEAQLIVEYTVNGHTNTKPVLLSGLLTIKDATSITEWEIGTKYTYRLVYSHETAKKDRIYFAPSTETWIDGGVIVVPL